MMDLKNRSCGMLKRLIKPLGGIHLLPFVKQIPKGWTLDSNKSIAKSFTFSTFRESIKFAHEIACIADEEKHCPDICIYHKRVDVELHTRAVNGLSEKDFIMAAKIESIKIH
jgi:4a-hydroxytetrahydrobiopterin dehydratase